MPLYEHVFISRQDLSNAQAEGLIEHFSTVLADNGGKVVESEYWGVKTMAYKINKNRKGHYVHMNFDSPWAPVAEVERQLRLNEDVIRYLTVRVEVLDNEPSAGILAKQAKERRDAKWGRREDEFGGGGFEPRSEEGAAS